MADPNPNLNIFQPISTESQNIIDSLTSLNDLSDQITGYNNTTKNIKTELNNQIESIDKTLKNVEKVFEEINKKCNNAKDNFEKALSESKTKQLANIDKLKSLIENLVDLTDIKKNLSTLSGKTKELVQKVANANDSDASELLVKSQTQESSKGATSVQASTDNTDSVKAELLAQQENAAAEAEKAAAEAETKRLAEEKAAAEANEQAAAEAEKAAAEAEKAADNDEANFREVTDAQANEQAAAEANEQAAAKAKTPLEKIFKELNLKDEVGKPITSANQLVNLKKPELKTAQTAIRNMSSSGDRRTTLANAITKASGGNSNVSTIENLYNFGLSNVKGGKRKKKTEKRKKKSKKRNHKITFRKKKKSIKRK